MRFMSKPCVLRLVRWCAYIFLGVVLLVASLVLKIVNKSCSYARAEQVQLDLCSQYHRHEISGSMCSALCDKRQFSLEFCGNNRARTGRKDVLVFGCDDFDLDRRASKVVMKIQVTESLLNKMANAVLAKSNSVESMINRTRNFVKRQIKMTFDEDYFITADEFLTGTIGNSSLTNLIHNSNMKTSYVKLKTVLALAMQPEFITLLALRKKSFMPKLYGHCGPAYFVEYTPPLTSLGYVMSYDTKSSDLLNMRFQSYTWSDRARLTLEFLDIIRRMDSIGKKPLQICDFKPHNFGINTNNNVAFLDSDDVVFDMRSKGRRCITDGDCTINYCSTYCDKTTKRCTRKRKNNNLEIACRYLFRGDYVGLLRSPPDAVREELRDTILRCTEPKRHNASAQTDIVDYNTLERLETVLRKSISLS